MVIQIVVEQSFSNNSLQKNYDTKTLSTNFLNYKLNNDNNNIFVNNNKLNDIEIQSDQSVNNKVNHENKDLFYKSHDIIVKETKMHLNKKFNLNELQPQTTIINNNDSLISKQSYKTQIASTSGISSCKLSQKSSLSFSETPSPMSIMSQIEKKNIYFNKHKKQKKYLVNSFVDETIKNEYEDNDSIKSDTSSDVSLFEINLLKRHYSEKKIFNEKLDIEDIEMDVEEHESSIEKRHKCNICGKGFPYMSILESHKRCHTGEKPFSCHFCDKKFAQKATLQVHERTHTGERPYKCKYCDKNFAQYGTKTVHEKSAHLGIRNYKCPKCSKCLSSPSALYTHKKTHGDKSFQCNFCPKQFTLKNYLKLHVKQVHEHSERKHICKFCSKTFAYPGSLQVHVRTHTGERPYVCKFCPKSFASQGNLQSHERTHTGERPYSCQHCGRSFIQKSQLTAHEATHTFGGYIELDEQNSTSYVNFEENKNVVDNFKYSNIDHYDQLHTQCASNIELSETTTASSSLTLLSVVATENDSLNSIKERNGKNDFVCKFCGKRYAYASSLYVHTRLHTGERPFKCNFCDKTFTNQGNMQVHLRVHTGEKPYKCDACNKSYAQKVGLKIHQEQCKIYLNRRGSVMTIETNDSNETSPSTLCYNECIENDSNALLNVNEQLIVSDKQKQLLINEKSILLARTINRKTSVSSINVENNNNQIHKVSSPPITQIQIYNNSISLMENDICKTSANNEKILQNNQNFKLIDTKILKNQHFLCVNENEITKKNENNNFINNIELTKNNEVATSIEFDNLLKPNLLLQSPFSSSKKQEIFNLQNSREFLQIKQQQMLTSKKFNTLESQIFNKNTLSSIQEDEQVLQYGIVPIQSNATLDLLLEQLEQQKKQQQQLQQLCTLKALIELTSFSNLQQILPNFSASTFSSLTLPSTSLPHPQPLYVQQQQLNLQVLQQQQHLLSQLLHVQKLEQQKKQILPLINSLKVESKKPQYLTSSMHQPTNLNLHKATTTIQLTTTIGEELQDLSQQNIRLETSATSF